MPDPAAPAAPDPSSPLWTLGWHDGSLDQEVETVYPLNGEQYDEWLIRFTTRSGTKGYVRVPAATYSADTVAATVLPVAEEIERVHENHGHQATGG